MTETADGPRRRVAALAGRARRALVVVLGLAALGACGDREPTGRDAQLRTTQFVEIIVAVRTAEQEVQRTVPADSVAAEFERRKAAILARYGATEEDVRAFVERHHARPGFMAEVWDTIAQRLRARPPEPEDDPPAVDPWEELQMGTDVAQ